MDLVAAASFLDAHERDGRASGQALRFRVHRNKSVAVCLQQRQHISNVEPVRRDGQELQFQRFRWHFPTDPLSGAAVVSAQNDSVVRSVDRWQPAPGNGKPVGVAHRQISPEEWLPGQSADHGNRDGSRVQTGRSSAVAHKRNKASHTRRATHGPRIAPDSRPPDTSATRPAWRSKLRRLCHAPDNAPSAWDVPIRRRRPMTRHRPVHDRRQCQDRPRGCLRE